METPHFYRLIVKKQNVGLVRSQIPKLIFNFQKISIFFLTLGALLAARLSWCHDVLPTTITVDESQIIREVPRELFGFNHNWIHSERLVWDKSKNQISSKFVNTLSGLPMPLNRMSGSVSQVFHWKQAVGPLDDRDEQQLAANDKKAKKHFGPLEWIESTRAIDPEAKFSWVFNMKTENSSDHADLVEFLTGDGTTNPNEGTNWAKKRIQLGLTEPLDGCIWELGNELDYGKHQAMIVETYILKCKEIIKAIRAIEPKARIAVHATTAPWDSRKYFGRDWREWHQAVLRKLGDVIDFISFHPYYLGIATAGIEEYLDVIRDDILTITGNDRIKIYISEHAVWPSKPIIPGKKWSANWYQTHSLSGCLGTAQFLNRVLSRPEITTMAYHSLSDGPWGLVYRGKNTGDIYTTGIYSLFKLFFSMTGSVIVESTVTGKYTDINSKALKFTVSASSTPKGINIIIVNRNSLSRNTKFKFRKDYRLAHMTTLTATTLDSYNTEDKREIKLITREIDSNTKFENYLIPPKSIYAFVLETIH